MESGRDPADLMVDGLRETLWSESASGSRFFQFSLFFQPYSSSQVIRGQNNWERFLRAVPESGVGTDPVIKQVLFASCFPTITSVRKISVESVSFSRNRCGLFPPSPLR